MQFFYDSYIEYITGKKKIWKIARYYFRLLKSTSGKWMGFLLCWIMVLHKNATVCVHECVCVLLIYFIGTPCVMCVCVRPLPFIGNSEPLYFCASHFSSIFYSLSFSSLLFLSLPRSFLGIRIRFYLCSTTHYWRTGWDRIGTIWVASGAIKKLPLPDGCKQSFSFLFLTFIYPQ